MNPPPYILKIQNGVRIKIYIQPNAKKPGLAGLHGDSLKIKVSSPPVDGAANESLILFFHELLKCPKSSINLVSGHTNRNKVLDIVGVDVAFLLKKLNIK